MSDKNLLFRARLQRLLPTPAAVKACSDATFVPPRFIEGVVSGRVEKMDPQTLERLVTYFDPETQVALTRDFLDDQLPAGLRPLVRIVAAGATGAGAEPEATR